jgi:hypothetical protein
MAKGKKDELRLTDGQFSWTAGVNSDAPKTKRIAGVLDDGVLQNQASWLMNCSVRGGGISQRPALQPLVQDAPWSGRYQGGMMYQPDYTDPILLLAIGGRFYRVRVDTDNSVTDLSTLYGHTNHPDLTRFHFAQAEMFAIIQAGDYQTVTNPTLPLFYDFGTEDVRPETFRRSNGFVGVGDATNEIPPAGPMDYYAHRLWYAFGRGYAAGDIVVNQVSGTAAYGFRDSVLHVTENPVSYSGDAFIVPTSAGNIRALAHASNIDTTLGESQLYVFTRRSTYACVAPVSRREWTEASLETMPIQKLALNQGGAYGDRCVVPVNGDLFFQGPPNGDIRTVQTAQRMWGQWGNVPLSQNITRALQFNDREMLNFASGIQFDNRMLQTILPTSIDGIGAGFQAVAPLNFDTVSTFEERKPPAWEGVWDLSGGPYILQLFEGDFGGRERAFAVVWSLINQRIEVWEIRPDLRFENGENRVSRIIEFPAYAFGDPLGLKELESGELWLDKILGTVDVEVWYRPDGHRCWQKWWAFQKCAAKDCREDTEDPCDDDGYPREPWCEQSAIPVTLPKPPFPSCEPQNDRPMTWGYQFQVKLKIKGWCRVRGIILKAIWRSKRPFEGLACLPTDETI